MIGIVIACHMEMADHLLETVSYVLGGRPEKVLAFSVELEADIEKMKLDLTLAIGEVDSGDGVLVLTDIIGGTPSALAKKFMQEKNIEVVTGVNLPMVLAAVNYRDGMSLARLSKMAVKAGKESIFSLKNVKKF